MLRFTLALLARRCDKYESRVLVQLYLLYVWPSVPQTLSDPLLVQCLLQLSASTPETEIDNLTLNTPIATKVVCFYRLLKCLRSLYGKQCGPRSDCSYRSSLFSAHAVCFYSQLVSNVRQLFAADDFSRRHFQMHFFLCALSVNKGMNEWKNEYLKE